MATRWDHDQSHMVGTFPGHLRADTPSNTKPIHLGLFEFRITIFLRSCFTPYILCCDQGSIRFILAQDSFLVEPQSYIYFHVQVFHAVMVTQKILSSFNAIVLQRSSTIIPFQDVSHSHRSTNPNDRQPQVNIDNVSCMML